MGDEIIHQKPDIGPACQMLVEAMSEGALVLSIEGTIIFCNQRFARMLELSASQVQGQSINRFIADSDYDHLSQLLLQSPHNIQIEIMLRCGDSCIMPTLFTMGTLKDHGQLQIYAVVKDRSESDVWRGKDLEDFTTSVSHDLRSPLRHIISFTELLSEHLQVTQDDQSRHYLDVINNAATDMQIMIDNLVYLFRINSSALNIAAVDLNHLVSNVVNSFSHETLDRNIEWDIGNLPDVSGDLIMLQTAFTCLISNALKFSRLEPVAKIRITLESGLAEKNNIVVSISDNGVGFDMQHAEKLFGVFQKMHHQKAFEGTGIGLATARRIARRHGGNVWAKGNCGHGAEFYISLPPNSTGRNQW